MAQLAITRGLPGSGKSTAAKAWVAENPAGRVRVNVDGLRTMGHDGQVILASDDTAGTEPAIQAGRDALVRTWLVAGFDVVVDELGLRDEIVAHLLGLAAECGADVEVWDFTNVPLATCLERNASRPETERVPDERIVGRWEQYIQGKTYPLPLPASSAGQERRPPMSRKNVASGNEHVGWQIGEVRPDPGKAQAGKPDTSRAENIREGNATVGRQIDHLEGDVHFF